MSRAIDWYDAHASEVVPQYEALSAESVHAWLLDLLPQPPALILDIGAGSGRDAAWFAGRGYDVVAVEPADRMRTEAQRLHTSSKIRWIADSLPDLRRTLRLGLFFDFVLLSAVWMHIAPADRARAFRKLITLVKPGGVIAFTLRQGSVRPERGCHGVSTQEIEQLSRVHAAFVERAANAKDRQGRAGVRWVQIAVRVPDEGSGALPLLRHIILNDDKASTYKLALLRVLCRIADGSAGYAENVGDEYVTIPLGLVALYWIRLFKPLLARGLPQNPRNIGDARLGFVKHGFRSLANESFLDFSVGNAMGAQRSAALRMALRDASRTIANMPARFTTYPNGGPIFETRLGRVALRDGIVLDRHYLSQFGSMRVPSHLWRAFQRFDVWIEPALISEWANLIKGYAERQGRGVEDKAILAAMKWSEPTRQVNLVRELTEQTMRSRTLYCSWTGRELTSSNLDIDHCLPWSAWPCGDLWNLLPADRTVNQRQKRERLPSDVALSQARGRIQHWWEIAYSDNSNRVLFDRFWSEARASLPGIPASSIALDELFTGLSLQRLRLRNDQRVPEWTPSTAPGA